MNQKKSPFTKASKTNRRLKLFLWGPPGTKKTILSLQFPKVVSVDMEKGSVLYGDNYDFDVIRTTDFEKARKSVKWLSENNHNYCTLVIDPITVYWEGLQKKWSDIFLKRRPGGKAGHKYEFYDFQAGDWGSIKSEFKAFIRDILELDMNVIVTAQQKEKYKGGGGSDYMKVIGETFDGEKKLPYMFDTIVRTYRDEKNIFMGECLKDRNHKLPEYKSFKLEYNVFSELFGNNLSRPATIKEKLDPAKLATIKATLNFMKEKGGLTDSQINIGLKDFEVDLESLENLNKEQADSLIYRIEPAALKIKQKLEAKKEDNKCQE
jgi:hypothetical protein